MPGMTGSGYSAAASASSLVSKTKTEVPIPAIGSSQYPLTMPGARETTASLASGRTSRGFVGVLNTDIRHDCIHSSLFVIGSDRQHSQVRSPSRPTGTWTTTRFPDLSCAVFRHGDFRPCGTVPPPPVTFGVHSPTWWLLRRLGAFHDKGDRMADGQDCAHHDDEAGIGNSEHDHPTQTPLTTRKSTTSRIQLGFRVRGTVVIHPVSGPG